MTDQRRAWPSLVLRRGVLLAALAGFVLGGLVFWGGGRSDQPSDPPPAETAAAAAEQIYTCSMHPQVRTTDPREKCPICGMDLIPVPMDDDGDDDGEMPHLRLTARAAALMQVQVYPVERRALAAPVPVYGRLDLDETRLRTITAWAPGRLDRLHVDFTGVEVRRGQPLIDLYSPALIAAQEEFLQTVRGDRRLVNGDGEVGQLMVTASRERLRLLGLTSAQIDALAQRGEVTDHVTINAPSSGTVVERLAATGDYVDTGQPIYRLADLSRLWAQLEIYETDLHWLALAQEVALTTQSYPGETFTGTISFISPVLGERTRTVRARVEVPNPDGRLKPGMFVRGAVQVEREASLVIPATAPLLTGRRAVVYVQLSDEDRPTFEPRDVLLGPRAGDWYLVQEGLREGDLVVTNGAFKIDSELQIRGRPSMMQPAGGPPPVHDHGAHEQPAVAATPQSIPAPDAFRRQLGQVVERNFELVAALAADDPAAASEAATLVDAALRQFDATLLDEGRELWAASLAAMQRGLAAVDAAAELPVQREHFEIFSDALTEAVHVFGFETTQPVYRAMCPMVQGRRGYWLQPDRTILNPYHGASMLRCGEIVSVLFEPTADAGGHH